MPVSDYYSTCHASFEIISSIFDLSSKVNFNFKNFWFSSHSRFKFYWSSCTQYPGVFILFRLRLEYYEQSCAVDSETKKCAGPTFECRKAMLGILGTELHTNCACKGTELNQLYGCLGWQRLLWVNPCVGKRKILGLSLLALRIQ